MQVVSPSGLAYWHLGSAAHSITQSSGLKANVASSKTEGVEKVITLRRQSLLETELPNR